MDIPGGAIETGYGEILIRSKGQEYDVDGFASIPIVSRTDGSKLLLSDIAKSQMALPMWISFKVSMVNLLY